ncbi:unnamed protein product, partial [Ectocarpus sp. 12 AP-2014]
PAAAAAVTTTASGGSSASPTTPRSWFLSVFTADEDAGILAMHERPGVARASSRALCLEVSADGFEGWRETWLGVLAAAAGSKTEDSTYLFFAAWRLLGTLPPREVVRGGPSP